MVDARERAAATAAAAALELVGQLEEQMSVYKEDSELSRLNRLAAAEPVAVEPGLFELLELAERLWRQSGGAFDIAAGRLVRLWGFVGGTPRVPERAEIARSLAAAGMQHVMLDHERRTVWFKRQGLELNLGAIGKGYALDRAAQLLLGQWGLRGALLHGGRSSVLAAGEPPDGQPWRIGLADPLKRGKRLGLVRLDRAALGTSGSTERYFERSGRRYSHVLDPRSGWPVQWRMCVSVLAPTAAEADALATAALVMGPEAACRFFARRPELGAVLVTWDAAETEVQLHVIGTAEELFEPAGTARR